MDHIQADLSKMSKEKSHWQNECYRRIRELESSKRRTSDALQPLRNKLANVEEQIDHTKQLIDGMKLKIRKNEDWIQSHWKRMNLLA